MTRTAVSLWSLACLMALCGCNRGLTEKAGSAPAALRLAAAHQTEYAVVKPDHPTDVDDYAVRVLTHFLFQKTGAVFPVVAPGRVSPDTKRIYIGLSAPARNALGPDPLAALKDQAYVCRSIGDDLYLYGKGIHGNFHAVLDFMETTLGRRWYTASDEPVFAVERDLVVSPFARERGFSFAFRALADASVFSYQQGLNVGYTDAAERTRNTAWYTEWSAKEEQKARLWFDERFPAGMVSCGRHKIHDAHALLCYVPPHPGQVKGSSAPFDWIPNSNYFKTNPDFFTMNKDGRRVGDRQLCFSNPALRRELTQNILEHIRRQGGDNAVVPLGHTDHCGPFCECPACKEWETKYAAPGGPFYDYLFELCALLETRHPDVRVKMLAYWSAMTRKPPVLPAGKAFPRNVIVLFCTVEEALQADWTHPLNASRALYEDVLAWRRLTPHLWVWCYPLPFGSCGACYLPFGNVRRMVGDIRLMKQADCEGVFFEFNGEPLRRRDGFAELQVYLACKLMQDVNRDVPALIAEFTDHHYGAAAPLVRLYRSELEDAQQALSVPLTMWPKMVDFYGQHAYLSPAGIRRWQGYFDRMEQEAAGDARCLENVRRLRRTLDFATLARWHELAKDDPDGFADYEIHKGRLGELSAGEKIAVDDFVTALTFKATVKEKPLPPPFDTMEPARVHRFTPVNAADPKGVLDSDAAFGFAATVDKPDMPFHVGFYQTDAKKQGAHRVLAAADIKPDVYQIYQLGDIEVTPDCTIWFSAKSWGTALAVGARLYEAGADNAYRVSVSLKFAGPTYGGTSQTDRVLCDQILLVRPPAAAAPAAP